jgi:hypothetical protein
VSQGNLFCDDMVVASKSDFVSVSVDWIRDRHGQVKATRDSRDGVGRPPCPVAVDRQRLTSGHSAAA